MTTDDIKTLINYVNDCDLEYNDDINIYEYVVRLPEDLHTILAKLLASQLKKPK